MKRILTRIYAWRVYLTFIGITVISAALVSSLSVSAANYTQITSQLDVGMQNQNVTNLQVFLAANPSIYPRNAQQVTITGLAPNTLYHYVIVATDASGNVSVWNPNTTFRTNY